MQEILKQQYNNLSLTPITFIIELWPISSRVWLERYLKSYINTLCLGLVTTATYHSLEINLRIPVTVIQNNYICCRQVNSQTTCSGAQHENKLGAVRHVEGIDLRLSFFMRCLSIKTTVVIALPETVVLQDVQHSCHLWEYQHSGALLLETDKQFVQHT